MKIYLVRKQITVPLPNSPICSSGKRIKASSRRQVLVRLLTSNLIILRVMAFSWTSQFVSKHGFFPLTSKNPLAWFCFTNVTTPQATLMTLCQLDDWIIMMFNFSHLYYSTYRESIINKNKR